MIDLDKLREIMADELEVAQYQKSIEITSKTVEDALKQASVELSIPISHLEYEVKSKGSKGIIGGMFLKKDWTLDVYPNVKFSRIKLHQSYDEEVTEVILNKNGDFGFSLNNDGKGYLKIIPPIGSGKPVEIDTILAYLDTLKNLPEIETETIEKALKNKAAVSKWQAILEYDYIETAKPVVNVSISDDAMRASVNINVPGNGSTTPIAKDITIALKNAGVTYGIKEEMIEEVILHPNYRSAILIAEGTPPEHGNDTMIEFIFNDEKDEESSKKSKTRNKNKKDTPKTSLAQVTSVPKGTVIAKVVPPSKGTAGVNVRGEKIAANDGVKKDFELGANVEVSIDKTKIIATTDGQPLFLNGVVSVEEIQIIKEDLKRDINFIGTLIIKGDVGDGYDVRAKGDIMVTGTVGRSQLTAGGNIIVDGGINGGRHDDNTVPVSVENEEQPAFDINNIVIRCGGNIWSKFIQNSKVISGNFIIVSDGILNSDVTAMKKVLLKGKRSAIIGGRVRSVEEINATILGSTSGTITHLEISVDPMLKDDLVKLEQKRHSLHRDNEQNKKSLRTLQEIEKEKDLTPKQLKQVEDLEELIDKQLLDLMDIEKKLEEDKARLKEGMHRGKISASKVVNNGVILTMYDIEFNVANSSSSGITFYEDIGLIHTKAYEEISDNISKDTAKGKFGTDK